MSGCRCRGSGLAPVTRWLGSAANDFPPFIFVGGGRVVVLVAVVLFVGVRLFPMQFHFEPYICIFRTRKLKTYVSAVRICEVWPERFRCENPMAQLLRFWAKIRRLRPSGFQIEKWHGL